MATSIPILGSDGNTYYIDVQSIQVGGVMQYIQLGIVADPISGAGMSVTAPGTSGLNAGAIQGIVNGVPIQVNTAGAGAQTANTSSVQVTNSSTTLLGSVNLSRIGFVIYCEGPSVIYVVYGPTAAFNPSGGGGYGFQQAPGGTPYIDTIPYYGLVSAITGPSASPSWVQITELT